MHMKGNQDVEFLQKYVCMYINIYIYTEICIYIYIYMYMYMNENTSFHGVCGGSLEQVNHLN